MEESRGGRHDPHTPAWRGDDPTFPRARGGATLATLALVALIVLVACGGGGSTASRGIAGTWYGTGTDIPGQPSHIGFFLDLAQGTATQGSGKVCYGPPTTGVSLVASFGLVIVPPTDAGGAEAINWRTQGGINRSNSTTGALQTEASVSSGVMTLTGTDTTRTPPGTLSASLRSGTATDFTRVCASLP